MNIATYIRNDLGSRLEAGRQLPAELTLDALARHYEVSYTPVRTAIAALTEDGLLTRKSNGRLEAAEVPTDGAETKYHSSKNAPAPSAKDPGALIIDELVRLSLAGKTIHLREEATAEKYGLSRSAMRNLFHRIAGQGLLEHVPRRGWRVRPFRQKDLQSFIEVREALELRALDLARPNLIEADLRAMLDGNLEPTSDDCEVVIDNSLHGYLVKKADNWYIQDFFERHGHYYGILFDWEDLDRPTAIATVAQHREILDALLDHKWARSRRALSFHIRENHPILSQIRESKK